MSNAIAVLQQDIFQPATIEAFQRVAATQHANFEREAGFAMQLVGSNEYLAKVAYDNRQSFVDAVINVSALGVTLNPAKKQAYLVPRDRKICLDISYMGLIDLAVECGSIMWAQAQVVYESETFQIRGYNQAPVHTRNPFAKDKGAIVGAYCVARLASGDYLTETMSIEEIWEIRDRSSAWKAYLEKKKKCPWVTDESEMCRKTVVKRAQKYWPRVTSDDRLQKAIHHLDTAGEEGLADVAERTESAASVQEWVVKAQSAKTEPELNTIYAAGIKVFVDAKDKAGATTFKDACLKHRAVLRQANTVDV